MVEYGVLVALVVLRVASVFVVKTWYVPDEYWQSLEVAHKLTFGYGYLTWEWTKGIRSFIHPLIIAGLYRALQYFQLDQVEYLILAPRIFQALLSAISDYSFYRWNKNSKWSLFVIIMSWFWFYTATRTLVNTIEACLTTIALSMYPRKYEAEPSKFLWVVAFLCFVRPTAAILWIPLCILHMIQRQSIGPKRLSFAGLLFGRYLPIWLLVGGIVIALDSYAYGRLIVTPYEFFKLNVLENVGSFYGTQPWYWYFNIGLPTILGLFIVPFLCGVNQAVFYRDTYPDRLNLLIATLFSLIVLSCLPHKEFRFLLLVFPICLHVTADVLKTWSRKAPGWMIWVVVLATFLAHIYPSYYLSWVHQRGAIDIMQPIEKIARKYRDGNGQRAKFLFLMPCHSTPFYSHVHQNVSMRFLTCEPNLTGQANYLDEADQFYLNPSDWVKYHVPVHPKSAMPTHCVLFDVLQPHIDGFLKSYKLINTVNHTELIYYGDTRVGNKVLLFERRPDEPSKKPKQEPKQEPAALNNKI